MKSLVGYTGFVGSNILEKGEFDDLYNSKNIKEAFGTNPDLLVFAGIRAEKYLANKEPEKDFEIVKEAFNNIQRIHPQKLVLVSTIDVYKKPANVDEDSVIDIKGLQPYGLNRYRLEQMVEESNIDSLIIRLPGLYGKNLKKNFIYDLIHIIPPMLTESKFIELCLKDDFIKSFYKKQDNGFYKCIELTNMQRVELKDYFNRIGFNALNFTDSRSYFQFYNLKFLWDHIRIALKHGLKKLNIATEPVSAADLYRTIRGEEFNNELNKSVPNYNFKTKYADLFNGQHGYIFDKEFIIDDIKRFVKKVNL
ncbi:MAG TPA: hypothetical protein DD434_05480 [Bacteroidales bacterium]|nr:hypothetical protein [Bacteroidales bacterium]